MRQPTSAPSNEEAMLAPHVAILSRARALVAKSDAHHKKYRETLDEALQATYELTLGLDKADTLRAFVEAQGEKWGKIAQERPFRTVVGICFASSTADAPSLSKYAAVLALAKKRQIGSDALIDWIRSSGGIEALAIEARAELKGADGDDDWFEETKEQHLERAVESLTEEHLGPAIAVKAEDIPPLVDADTYPAAASFRRALVRVKGSKIEVVRLVPSTAAEVAADLRTAVPVEPNLAGRRLQDKPHYELFRAADIFLRFVRMAVVADGTTMKKSGKVEIGRAGLLFTYSGRRWRAQTTSTLSTFPICEFFLDEPIDGLDPKATYLIEAFALRSFVEQFKTAANPAVGRGAKDDLRFELFGAGDVQWRKLRGLKPVAGDLTFDNQQLAALGAWESTYKKGDEKTERAFPKLFQPFANRETLWLVFPGLDPHRRKFGATTAVPPSDEQQAWRPFGSLGASTPAQPIPPERWLTRADIQALAGVASDYGVELSGQFMDAPEDFAALQLKTEGFQLTLPLAVSLAGDLAQITK